MVVIFRLIGLIRAPATCNWHRRLLPNNECKYSVRVKLYHIRRASSFKEISVDLDVLLPFFWSRRLFEDGSNRAGRLACTAVDALVRIDVQLLSRVKIFFVLCGMDAIDRTDIYA